MITRSELSSSYAFRATSITKRAFIIMIPLSLYIHFPWCIQKCPYCDFNSHKNNEALYEPYMQTLIDDVTEILPYIWGRKIHSIFIGGGTPSLMPPKLLDQFFSQLRTLLNFNPNIEITMEANPGTVDSQYFKAYREIGINRLSIGVQSLNDVQLEKIGRIHSSSEALRAFDIARNAGFENINCDLMFGLPLQNLEGALSDLEGIIALEPEHISHYQLTLEPNTYFHRYEPELPADEVIEAMQLESHAILKANGYGHYEVSAFAKTGKESQHNRNYWEFGDYIGIGAGAHGKITMMNNQEILRTQMEKHPRTYVEKTASMRMTKEAIAAADLPFEFFLNTLRLKSGVPTTHWSERTFLPLSNIAGFLQANQEKGLLLPSNEWITPTEKGHLFVNTMLEAFL